MKIKSIKKTNTPKHVYDITVDKSSRYVLGNGLLTHNSALVYTSSTIIYLSKSKDKDGTEQVGIKIRAKLPKSRLTIENSQVMTQVNFRTGINRYYGLAELAADAGVVTKDGNRYLWTDGKKYYEKALYKEPEKFFTKDILDAVDAHTLKTFTYQGGEDDGDLIGDIDEDTSNEE